MVDHSLFTSDECILVRNNRSWCDDDLAWWCEQVSCAWGFTTTGGAKGVGESTTSAVVISLVLIFIADFFLSFLFFQGQGDALRQCM